MNLINSSSLAITNILSILCRIISCESEYSYPTSNVGTAAGGSNRMGISDSSGSTNNIFDSVKNLEVVTNTGRLRGYYMTNVRGNPVGAFEGIPYAEPPTKNRRFLPPVPKKPWHGTLQANNPGSPCIQFRYGRVIGREEDCLFLNVYVPNGDVNPSKPYPVIVFIHGGFWLSGSGQHFGPAYLLKDVILVTFNYRLGPLGFFTTGTDAAPGNNGLRDQATAIDWVHNNIASFGGNPSSISLVGVSAGAVSTHLHMISNSQSRSKIKSAISMSGTAYNIWGLNKLETAKMVSSHLANVSGCPTDQDSFEVVKCLQRVDANVFVANQLFTFQTGFFIPSIEPKVAGAFLTNTPDQAYLSGNVAKVPWIATMTAKELNLPVTPVQANVLVHLLRAAFNADLASLLTFKRSKGVKEDIVRKQILQFYTGSDSVNSLSQEAISQIATDRYFTVPIRKALQMHSQVAPTYASIFNYTSKLGRAGRAGLNPANFAPFHGDDLVYFLNSTKNHPPIGRYDSHFAITKLLVNLFGNFAEYGEPIYETETGEIYKIWNEIDNRNRLRFLWIDEEVKMIDDPYKKVADFWESLSIPDTTASFKLRPEKS